MVSRHVGRTRCGKSLMQGWGGRRSGRATHACPFRLPLSAGNLRSGRGGKEKLAECSTDILLENAVFSNVLVNSSTLPLMSSVWFGSARVHCEFAKWLAGYKEGKREKIRKLSDLAENATIFTLHTIRQFHLHIFIDQKALR